MERNPKEIIEDFKYIVKPFIANLFCKINYENLGEQDKVEFGEDFDVVLNLAEIGLKHIEELQAMRKEINSEIFIEDDSEPVILADFVLKTIDEYIAKAEE